MNTPGRSLYVRLQGPDYGPGAAGKWTDAATGEHGDLLDLIAPQPRSAPPRRRHGRGALLSRPAAPAPTSIAAAHRPRQADPPKPRAASFAPAARFPARPPKPICAPAASPRRSTGPPCAITRRSITAQAEDAPLELWPALLAAVTDLAGTITGILRTWLDPPRPAKAPLADPRRALGHLLGNGVRFGDAADILAAGEGVETMLALKSVLPLLPMIAGLSANHLAALDLPPALRRLYVARDNDAAGLKAAQRLARTRTAGLDVRELVPVHGDFNLDLCRLGPDGLRAHLADQLVPSDRARFRRSSPLDPQR